MTTEKRYRLALVSYWLLFIITPIAALFLTFGPHVGIGVIIVFILIGERGFRAWKRFWKVDE